MSLHLDHLTFMCCIIVYDIDTLVHQVRVEGLFNKYDMVAHAYVLYANEWNAKLNSFVRRNFFKLVCGRRYLRMSINKKGNIVVSCPIVSCSNRHQPPLNGRWRKHEKFRLPKGLPPGTRPGVVSDATVREITRHGFLNFR